MKLDGKNLRNLIGWALLATLFLLLADRPARFGPSPNATVTFSPAAGGKETGKRSGAGSNEDNWPDVVEFMKKNSRHKLEAYKNLPEAAQPQVRAQLIARYNELDKLSNNPALHKIEVDRVKIEDDLFEAMADRRKQHVQGGPYSGDYLDAVERLVKNRMDERKVRLQDLKELVTSLDAQVTRDERVQKNTVEFGKRVQERAGQIEKNGLGAATQGSRRRIPGQPATSESEEEITPANP